MARHLFPGDTVFVPDGDDATIGDGIEVTFFDDRNSSTEYTDLVTPDGVTPYAAITDEEGNYQPFLGPDEVVVMWRETGNSIRYPVFAVDSVTTVLTQFANLQQAVAEVQALIDSGGVGGGGGLPVDTDLDDIPDGATYKRMTVGERNKLATVAANATAVTLGTASTQAKPGNWPATTAEVSGLRNTLSAVQNKGGVGAFWYHATAGEPTGVVDGDFVIKPQ